MMKIENQSEREKLYGVLGILMLGGLWGLLELLCGHYLRVSYLPLKGAVLTGLGMGVMGLGFGIRPRASRLPYVGLVTAFSMELGVLVLHCSPMCRANAMLAVSLHGLVMGSVLMLAGRGERPFWKLGFLALFAALGSSCLFYPLGVNLAPCRYLLSYGAQGGALTFFLREGLLWGAFSAVLFPAGVSLGRALREPLRTWRQQAPGLFLASSSLSLALCLGVMVLCLRAGF